MLQGCRGEASPPRAEARVYAGSGISRKQLLGCCYRVWYHLHINKEKGLGESAQCSRLSKQKTTVVHTEKEQQQGLCSAGAWENQVKDNGECWRTWGRKHSPVTALGTALPLPRYSLPWEGHLATLNFIVGSFCSPLVESMCKCIISSSCWQTTWSQMAPGGNSWAGMGLEAGKRMQFGNMGTRALCGDGCSNRRPQLQKSNTSSLHKN